MRYWSYDDEESFKSSLKNLVLLIEEYGLPELVRLSVESEVIPTNEMGAKLVSSHKELSEKFIQENQLDVSNISNKIMTARFDTIEQKMQETKDEPYQNIQDTLVEIAAFWASNCEKKLAENRSMVLSQELFL